jgi:hypothetical protein
LGFITSDLTTFFTFTYNYFNKPIAGTPGGPKNIGEEWTLLRHVVWFQFRPESASPVEKTSLKELNANLISLVEKAKALGLKLGDRLTNSDLAIFCCCYIKNNNSNWDKMSLHKGDGYDNPGDFTFVLSDIQTIGGKSYAIAKRETVTVTNSRPYSFTLETPEGFWTFGDNDLSSCKGYVRFDLDTIASVVVAGDSLQTKSIFEQLNLPVNPALDSKYPPGASRDSPYRTLRP